MPLVEKCSLYWQSYSTLMPAHDKIWQLQAVDIYHKIFNLSTSILVSWFIADLLVWFVNHNSDLALFSWFFQPWVVLSVMQSEQTALWECTHCSKEFKYESEKRRHEQSHVPQFGCKICSKKFSFLWVYRYWL